MSTDRTEELAEEEEEEEEGEEEEEEAVVSIGNSIEALGWLIVKFSEEKRMNYIPTDQWVTDGHSFLYKCVDVYKKGCHIWILFKM